MNGMSIKIKSFHDHRVKKFEKEIRRYLKKKSQVNFVLEETGEVIEPHSFHAYMFKSMVERMYSRMEEKSFPFHAILMYAQIHTLRDLKTDSFEYPYSDEYDLYLEMIKNYDIITISVYDDKFLHRPEIPYWDVWCAVNKKRKAIIPMKFSKDLSKLYPNWFYEGELVALNKSDGDIDFDLLERVKLVMS